MRTVEAEEIIQFHIAELYDKPASLMYHLNKKGGLMIHLNNVWKLAVEYFPNDETLQALALIHDIGKGRTYKFDKDGFRYVDGPDHVEHTINMITESGYDLIEEEIVALKMHHGGWAPFKISMNELAINYTF